MSRPPKFQLVDLKLGGGLEFLLAERRKAEVSYDNIAFEIRERTGIAITGVTVWNWVKMLEQPAEAAS